MSALEVLMASAPPLEQAPADAIVLDQLAKTYPDGTEAVRGISARIGAGEAYGILGPNGAGKSTTIGMLGTLIRPTAGRALVAGLDVVGQSIGVRRRIGFAMQEAGIDEFATASELLVLQGRLHGVPKATAVARADLLLEIVELNGAGDKRLGTLSGGMKRRVDLAAALMHLPPILFLDEPTEGLDPRSRATIWDALDQLRRHLGVTLVLTTHFMDEADRLCDRIGIIDRGALVVEGTPAALKAGVGSEALVIDFPPHATAESIAIARGAVAAHHAVEGVLAADRDLSVLVDDAAGVAPEILRILEQGGAAPRSLAITRPTLEDAYLRYTGRAFEAATETDQRVAA